MNASKEIADVIAKHRTPAGLSARFVGCAPTYEWTGRATPELLADLRLLQCPFETFIADVREHPDFGKRCVSFTVFGRVPGQA